MTFWKLAGIAIGVVALGLADYKAWRNQPAKPDGTKPAFDVWTAAPRWIVGALAGDQVGGAVDVLLQG